MHHSGDTTSHRIKFSIYYYIEKAAALKEAWAYSIILKKYYVQEKFGGWREILKKAFEVYK